MENSYVKVKNYLQELGYHIVQEDEKDGVLVIEKHSEGINKLFLICADPMVFKDRT